MDNENRASGFKQPKVSPQTEKFLAFQYSGLGCCMKRFFDSSFHIPWEGENVTPIVTTNAHQKTLPILVKTRKQNFGGSSQ
jgi:hypothetical protein